MCVCHGWGFVYHCTKQEMPDASELTIESFAEFMRNSGHVLEQLEESFAATQAQHKVCFLICWKFSCLCTRV